MDYKKINRGGGGHISCQISHFVPNFGRELNNPSCKAPKLPSPKPAFTLAEVLITLAIIGIVAALTIPSVVVNYQKQQTAIKLKKAYNTLAQTTNMAIKDHGPIKNWDCEENKTKEFVDKYVAPYLNVVKVCGYETTGACKFDYANLNDQGNPDYFREDFYKLVLQDGSVLLFKNGVQTGTIYSKVIIDVNGQKAPNVYGKDLFVYGYWVYLEGSDSSGKLKPNCSSNTREALISSKCNKEKNGQCCSALIMQDGWQIKDDYPW